MKNAAFIPWGHIDALSYGPVDYYVQQFQSWLYGQKRAGVRILILPNPDNTNNAFSLGLASLIIEEEATHLGFGIVKESTLLKRGLIKKKSEKPIQDQSLFVLVNAFHSLQVVGNVLSIAA